MCGSGLEPSGWGEALGFTSRTDKAGTILSLLLPFPVFTMGLMPRVAMKVSRGRNQDSQRHNQPTTQ